MIRRLRNAVNFWLERLVLRGVPTRFLLTASLIGLVSLVAAALVQYSGQEFDSFANALWWAFLRLTDPGYLGDDEGTARRVISTVLTVLGYVIFLGALVAILTQWLNETIRKLEKGLTPVALRGHVVVLGWTSRTAIIVRELLSSDGRVRRFLRRSGARRLVIAVLDEQAGPLMHDEMKNQVGQGWSEPQVILRSGSPLRLDHLRRVDVAHASVVIVCAEDQTPSGAATSDVRVLKALMTIQAGEEHEDGAQPLVVAELLDGGRKEAAQQAAGGGELELIASDQWIARLILQTLREPGLLSLFSELLTREVGRSLFVREDLRTTGLTFASVVQRFEQAIVLGFVRRHGAEFVPWLAPAPSTTMEQGDVLVLLASNYEATEVLREDEEEPQMQPSPLLGTLGEGAKRPKRVLVLGWSGAVARLIEEASEGDVLGTIDVLSLMPLHARVTKTRSDGVSVKHYEGDYTDAAILGRLEPQGYDHVLIASSERLEPGAETDARSMVGLLTLDGVLRESERRPTVFVELMDPANASLIAQPNVQVLVSPLIIGRILTHVGLRRELRSVYEELLALQGAQLISLRADSLGLAGVRFEPRRLQALFFERHMVLIGRHSDGVMHFADSEAEPSELTGSDRLLVLQGSQLPSSNPGKK